MIKNKLKLPPKIKLYLWLIFIFGFLIRVIGFNWDQGQHLHPDERFLTMVATDITVPTKISDYIDPVKSSLNPYNNNYDFYVYGSLPVNLVRIVAQSLHLEDYDHIYLVGRLITIILDSSIILLVFLITLKISNYQNSLLASFLYSFCVLPIQLSHFFTVDPFLNFFIVAAFYFLIQLKKEKHHLRNTLLLSTCFAFALASKISALYFSPIIFIFFIFNFKKDIKAFLKYGLIFVISFLLLFRFSQPQVFTTANYLNWQPNPQFVQNLKELKQWDKNPYYPPSIQWIKVTPLLFPLKNMILWGLGIPIALIFAISLCFIFVRYKSFKNETIFLVLLWVIFLILFQGSQAVSTMRYFLPVYPFICILSAIFLGYLLTTPFFKKYAFLKYLILVLLMFPSIMFSSIFFKKHTRVQASLWIYQNIPFGSTIATEYWDDSLPLSVGSFSTYLYQYQSLHIADVEEANLSKMTDIQNQLDQSDYLILSSNRFYKPIPENSDIFPQTTSYYQSLFDGSLGFKKVAEFSSYPCFLPFGKTWFCLNDDSSEEAFTVYDHPKVIIFQKFSHTDQ